MLNNFYIKASIVFFLWLASFSVLGAEPNYEYFKAYGSPAEISTLPEYCRGRLSSRGTDKRLYNKWKKIVGGDFIHFHHH